MIKKTISYLKNMTTNIEGPPHNDTMTVALPDHQNYHSNGNTIHGTTPHAVLPGDKGEITQNNENKKLDDKNQLLFLFQQRNVAHPTSNLDTMMHIFKGNIGTGILALPSSFVNSGLTFGVFGLIVIATICIHCMHLVLKCGRTLSVRTGKPSMDFATTAELAFSTSHARLRKYAKAARFITNLFLCVTQFGFCCIYVTFIASNIQETVEDTTDIKWDIRIYMSIIVLPLLLTCLIQNLKYLVPFSIFANILQVVSLVIIFYYLFQDMPSAGSRKQFSSIDQLPLWLGTTIYSFEGIGLVLPFENNMKSPQDFGGITGVFNTGMSIVCILFIAVGFYGYLKYGDNCKGSITLNLPQTIPAEFVRVAYAAATLLSFSLQFYVPIKIMWPAIKQRISPKYQLGVEIIFRSAFVLLTYALAVLIPQLNLFISLVGALGGSYLSIIIPPILDLATHWSEGLRWYSITKNIVIIIIGFLGFATGSYASIYNIITSFGDTS